MKIFLNYINVLRSTSILLLLIIIRCQSKKLNINMQDYVNDLPQHKVNFKNCNVKDFDKFRHDEEIIVTPFWTDENDKDAVKEYDYDFKFIIMKGPEIKFPVYDNFYFVKPPYATEPGHVAVEIRAKKKPNSLRNDLPDNIFGKTGFHWCVYMFEPHAPVAIINGGSDRVVAPSSDIELDGSFSYDINYKNNSKKGLTYEWTCKQKLRPPTVCKEGTISTAKKFRIPQKDVRNADIFKILLIVKSKYGSKGNTTQTISVRRGAANLLILCQKNCPPQTEIANSKIPTYLEVKCKKNCKKITKDDFEWAIKSKTNPYFFFDYNKGTYYGNKGISKFIIKPNSLKPGTYIVNVKLINHPGRKGNAAIEITYGGPPKVKSCSVIPDNGHTLKTLFNFHCKQESDDDKYIYEFISRKRNDFTKEEVLAEGSGPNVFQKKFFLPSSERYTFFVKVMQVGRPDLEVPVNVAVKSLTSNQTSAEVLDTLKNIYNGDTEGESLPNMVLSKDPKKREKGLSIYGAIVDELMSKDQKDDNIAKFVEDLKQQAPKDLVNVSVSSINEVLTVANAISKLYDTDKKEPANPNLALVTATICDKMAQKLLKLMKNEKYPLTMTDKATDFNEMISKCVETFGFENPNLMEPIDFNITTEAPYDDDLLNNENFPNYQDFPQKYYMNIDTFKAASEEVLNASYSAAKATSLTLVTGDQPYTKIGKTDSLIISRNEGHKFQGVILKSHGVLLLPPEDFVNDDHVYDIMLTTYRDNIMWFNPDKTYEIATDIAMIQIRHSMCKAKVLTFKKPLNIFFDVSEDIDTVTSMEDFYEVPEKFDKMNTSELNYQIKVYRIVLPRLRMLNFKFTDVSQDDSLEYVITNFSYPTLEDFKKKNYTIIASTNKTYFINEAKDHILVYVGILAKKGTTGNITFMFRWYGISCLKWSRSLTKWQIGCMPGKYTANAKFHCACYTNFSIIAGCKEHFYIEHKKILLPDFELEIIAVRIIFITVCVTYAIFFLLLMFSLTEKRKKQIYFLADNDLEHPFVYLLIIKTAVGYNAGTSSNVVIKLIGKKKSSDPHVLNYPDPKSQILQAFGNDMFVLTTESHLGEIKEIELWFDSIGPNAAWHCREILVYDMQLRTEKLFNVSTKLSVKNAKSHVTVVHETENDNPNPNFLKKHNIKINFSQRYHTWALFRHEEHLSFTKKLTIVFSNTLTIYVLVLLFHRMPRLELKDSLENRHNWFINAYAVFVGFVASFFACLFHLGIAWCFRFSQLQLTRYRNLKKLPVSFTYACWSILIIMIVTSTTFLVFIGFWVQFYSSIVWLFSCIVGILFSIFIFESLFSMVINIFFKLETVGHNIDAMFNDIREAINIQRLFLYSRFGTQVLKPYFEHLYQPLTSKQLKRLNLILKQRSTIIAEFEDLLMFSIYIIILYSIILAEKDILMVYAKTEMSEVIEGVHTRSMRFSDVDDILDVPVYINNTLLPVIHPTYWYGNFAIIYPGLTIDVGNKMIGVVRIRQQRMIARSCKLADQMKFLNMSCWPKFSLFWMETKTHSYGWKDYAPYMAYDRMKTIWEYKTEAETNTLPYIGKVAIYGGGGYIVYLGRKLYNSYVNVCNILNKHWFDSGTRVVFIEFLTYNQNYNIFNSVTLLIEQSVTGLIRRTVNVVSARMLFVGNEIEFISFILFFFFIVWVILMLIKQTIGTVKHFHTVWKEVWFFLDTLIVLLSITSICLFLVRTYLVGNYVKALERVHHNEFVNYFFLFYIEDVMSYVAGFLVGIATIRLWKFLRFGSMFRKLERTLSIAASYFLSFAVLYLAMLVTFALTFYLLMGTQFTRVRTVARTMRIMTTMALKPREMVLEEFLRYKTAIFVITVYMIVLQLAMFTLIMIIVMAYLEAQLEISCVQVGYSIYNYIDERMNYIPTFLRYKFGFKRLKSGFDELQKVKPKSDKFIYLFSRLITTNRMLSMKYLTQCFIRNTYKHKTTNKLSDRDINLMLNVCRTVLIKPKEQEVDVFYKGRVQGQRLRFVDERQIEKIANITNIMLQEELPEFPEIEVTDKKLQTCSDSITEYGKMLRRCDLALKLVLDKWYIIERNIKKELKHR